MLRFLGFGAAVYIAAAAAVWGTNARLDEQLRLARDYLRPHQASGNVVIVEIDARSLKAIADWPWPRRSHAALVDRLREGGARTIAFDVDLSARSNTADDAMLAASLARAGGSVILPTFRQSVSEGSRVFSENMPIAPFRAQAFLGSVNVQPDADGQLRNYSYGTVTAGIPRPSIAALLAESQAKIGTSFRVDTAIDPATIPRVSAINVLNGKTSAIKGRAVLIGATAVEMGDRYAVPGRGVLPGVVVQALAAETLILGSTNPDWGPWPALLFSVAVLGIGLRARSRRYWLWWGGALVSVTVAPLMLELARVATLQIVPALLFIALDSAVIGLLHLQRRLRDGRLTDTATGLPNGRALARSCRHEKQVAIMVVRVPQFDQLAAVLDAADGKQLMTQIVNRLLVGFPQAEMHAMEAGILAWPSAVLVSHDDAESAGALFRAPIMLAGRSVLITPVFGVSMGEGSDVDHLLARANIAAREAQAAGRRWAVESSTLSRDADRSIAIIADVANAIVAKDIYVVYQAKWDVAERRICGAEALARWTHPQFGALSPDEFVPVLEHNGQMKLFTLGIVDVCLAQLRTWHAGGHHLGMAVNISAPLLDDRDFVAELQTRIEGLGELASHLTLEVTESATIASTQAAVAALTIFRSLGARVSIDDYGTGQATLAYLKSFPADEIKIDKGFVTNMLTSASDQIVVRSTIELAHQLGFEVVAEGVEDQACLDRLGDYGCDTIQGWVIGKPVSADLFVQSLEIRKAA